LGDIDLEELPLFFLPLDPDILSLSYNDTVSSLYLHKDRTVLFDSALALNEVQKMYGLFPKITGKGDKAKRLCDLLLRMSGDQSDLSIDGPAPNPSTVIDKLVIIDREVDFVTPLMTQLTYEGLIDETYNITNGWTIVTMI